MTIRNAVTVSNAWGLTFDVVDPLDNAADWSNSNGGTGTSSVTTVLNDGPNDEDIIRHTVLTNDGEPQSDKTLTTPFVVDADGVDGAFAQYIRVTGLDKWTLTFGFWFNEDPPFVGTYEFGNQLGSAANATPDSPKNGNGFNEVGKLTEGEWHLAQWRPSAMSNTGGAPVWGNPVNFEALRFLSKGFPSTGDAGLIVDYSNLTANAKHDKAIFLFSFDDSNGTDRSIAADILAAAGFTGTTYTLPRVIGTGAFLELDELHELNDDFGWTVGSHGVQVDSGTFANISLMTLEQQITELEAVRDYMIANSFPDWQHYSFPEGKYNNFSETALNTVGFFTSRTVEAASYTLQKGFPLYFTTGFATSRSNTGDPNVPDPTILTDRADKTVLERGVTEFFTHVLQSTGVGNQTQTAAFQTLVTHVKGLVDSDDAIVVNKKQLHNEALGLGSPTLTTPINRGISKGITRGFGSPRK